MHELAEDVRADSGRTVTGGGSEILRESRGRNAEKLILGAYLLWLTGSVLSVTMWEEYGGISVLSGLLRRTAHFLLLFEFLQRENYTKKDVAGVVLLVYTGIVSGHSVHNSFVLPTLLFVFFSSRVRFRVILKATLLLQSVLMAVTIAASQTGIIEDIIWYEGERVRHSLGYDYCGYPAHFLLFMTLMWLCLRRRPRVTDTVFLLAANYLMYYFTDSRTDFYLSVLAAAGAFIWTAGFRLRWICALRGFLTSFGAAAAAVVSIAAHCFYNPENPFLSRLNLALNNRLQFGFDAVQNYGFSLFGKEIRWIGQSSLRADPGNVYNYVDCAFLKDGLTFGLLFLLLLLAGFYLAGRKLARENRYMESWALLVSLAYAMINAHLCVLYFNVFILLPGEIFSDGAALPEETGEEEIRRTRLHRPGAGEIILRLKRRLEDMEKNAGRFADVLHSALPAWIYAKNRQRALRTVLFLLCFLYLTVVQCRPNADAARLAGMHMWVAAGFLLLFAALCKEEKKVPAQKKGHIFRLLLLLFLLLAGLSDLVINKRFRSAPFLLLVFGGLFCESWRGMNRPQQLLEEFRWACRAGFGLGLFYCIAARPAMPGIRYSGFLPDPQAYGAVMTVLLAVFLSGIYAQSRLRQKTAGAAKAGNQQYRDRSADLKKLAGLLDGTGAVTALYLIWLTQEFSAVLSAAAVLLTYAVFLIRGWAAAPGREKLRGLLELSAVAAAGLAAVLLLRFLLYRTAPALGTQIIYARDKNRLIKVPLREGLLSAREWGRYFSSEWKVCRAYLRRINLTGHYYRAKYRKKEVWAANSIVMNLYRYGAGAGVCYGLLLPASLWTAVKDILRRNDFLTAGLVISSAAAGMTAVTELPFANLNWMLFYFSLACLERTAASDGGKHEIFKYGNRQSVL